MENVNKKADKSVKKKYELEYFRLYFLQIFPCINSGIMTILPEQLDSIIANRFGIFKQVTFGTYNLLGWNIFLKQDFFAFAHCAGTHIS